MKPPAIQTCSLSKNEEARPQERVNKFRADDRGLEIGYSQRQQAAALSSSTQESVNHASIRKETLP
jgi:hypothetical protein